MPYFLRVLLIGLCVVASGLQAGTSAQTTSPGGWLTPDWGMPAINNATRKPAPRRDLEGTWAPFGRFGGGTQAGGVQAKPNNGRPENQLPYTPFGLELYKAHKALEGADAVPPANGNDPRNLCEPLGMPRTNHYNLGLTQIFQTPQKVAVLYQYDNRWRVIWTDGRQLPTLVDGGVDIAGELREQRWVPAERALRTRRLRAGKGATFALGHVHDVVNSEPRHAVSVHAYSPPLTAMSYYAVDAAGDLRRTRTVLTTGGSA